MKHCGGCKKELSIDNFNKQTRRKDGLQPWCKECNRTRSRQYYSNNKDKHLVEIKKRKNKNLIILQYKIIEYLEKYSCVDCGFKDIRALEFDHLNDKKFSVSKMVANNHSWENILNEISKCEIRCANCQRIKTSIQYNHYRNKYIMKLEQDGTADAS